MPDRENLFDDLLSNDDIQVDEEVVEDEIIEDDPLGLSEFRTDNNSGNDDNPDANDNPDDSNPDDTASADASSTEEDLAARRARSKSLSAAGVVHDITVNVNGSEVILGGKASYVFVDVFEFIDFDLSSPKGRTVVTTLNGKNAQYMESIDEGDEIDVHWED